jgi:hypothetical protein
MGELGFDYGLEQQVFSSTLSRPSLGPSQPHVQ